MLVILASLIGFYIRDSFFETSFSQLKNGTIQLVSHTVGGQFYSQIVFALSIGIIPLLYLIVQKITKLKFMYHGLLSCVLILSCGIALWQFRILQLNNQLQKLSEFKLDNGVSMDLNIENLYFGRYLCIGFLVGTLISILVFRKQTKIAAD